MDSKPGWERHDVLNDLLMEAEENLGELRPPKEIWVSTGQEEAKVGVQKIKLRWRLMYDSGTGKGLQPIRPLRDCSSDIRINSVKALVNLFQAIEDAKQDRAQELEDAIRELSQLLGKPCPN